MLVTMKHQPRAVSLDVGGEGEKALMGVTVALVDETGRVVADENVDPREARKRLLNLRLIEEVMTAWLVSPSAAKTAEANALHFVDCEVRVADGRPKWRGVIVVSLHRKDRFGPMPLSSGQEQRVGKITQTDDHVRFALWTTPLKVVAVGYSENSHFARHCLEIGARQGE